MEEPYGNADMSFGFNTFIIATGQHKGPLWWLITIAICGRTRVWTRCINRVWFVVYGNEIQQYIINEN